MWSSRCRARARTLVGRANELAARINAGWTKNPYQIQTLGVSGSYMSRRDPPLLLVAAYKRLYEIKDEIKDCDPWLLQDRRPQSDRVQQPPS